MLEDRRNIIIQPSQLRSSQVMKTPHGLTICGIIDQMYEQSHTPMVRRTYDVMVEVDGVPVPKSNWNLVPKVDSHVLVSIMIQGGGEQGKLLVRAVMMLAVVVMAIYAPYMAPSLLMTNNAVNLLGSAVQFGIMTAGMLLVNAIAPIRQPSQDIIYS